MTPIFPLIRLPKKWFNSEFDININVTAFVSIVDDTWYINIKSISYPGWYSASFDNRYKQDFYELVEHKCIEKYREDKLKQEDYVL